MSAWQIRPRDPLVFSDGRPFQTGLSTPSALELPWPSTLVGMFCTALGRDENGHFALNAADARELYSRLSVRGPLLVAHDAHQDELLAPAPSDALWIHDEQGALRRHRLAAASQLQGDEARAERLRGALYEVAAGEADELVYPLAPPPKGKASRPFAYWRWSELERWLVAPEAVTARAADDWRSRCVARLPQEYRTHVTLCSTFSTEEELYQRAALDGHLFGTWNQRYEDSERRYSLWATLEAPKGAAQREAWAQGGWAHLGGEKRLVELKPSAAPAPAMSADLRRALEGQRRVRVVLLTPALFSAGDRPSWLLEGGHRLVAQVVGRPQAVSGWDVAKQRPKAARRMAPAGSVYWIELAEGTSAAQWAEGRFMSCVSDAEADRRQGFGLCVVGVA